MNEVVLKVSWRSFIRHFEYASFEDSSPTSLCIVIPFKSTSLWLTMRIYNGLVKCHVLPISSLVLIFNWINRNSLFEKWMLRIFLALTSMPRLFSNQKKKNSFPRLLLYLTKKIFWERERFQVFSEVFLTDRYYDLEKWELSNII